MESADPQAAPLFRQNAEALQAEISSTGIDFSSALSTCPTHLLVTPDGAFASTARSYDLTQVILAGPASAARIADVAAQVRESGRAGVLSQPWVDDSGLATLASSTGDRVHAVDTLVDPPAPGPSAPKDYRQAMEKLLQELASALGCSTDQ
jgi:ABC-type Zn uptake system ZnuABC Zn-binding protein ZnuA